MCLCCKFSCFTCAGDQSSAGARKQKQNALRGKSSSGGGQPARSGKGKQSGAGNGKQSSKNQKENDQQDCFSSGGQGQQGQQGCFSCWSGGATNQEPNAQLELKAGLQTNQDVDGTSSQNDQQNVINDPVKSTITEG